MRFLKERQKAFAHAGRGIGTFFREGIHAQVMLVLWLLTLGCGIFFELLLAEWVTIILTGGLVLGLEALNSALEYVVDICSPEKHPLAKKAKDVAAAGVLLASLCAALIGLLIFVPKIMSL